MMTYTENDKRDIGIFKKCRQNNEIIHEIEILYREMKGILQCQIDPPESERVLLEMKRILELLRGGVEE